MPSDLDCKLDSDTRDKIKRIAIKLKDRGDYKHNDEYKEIEKYTRYLNVCDLSKYTKESSKQKTAPTMKDREELREMAFITAFNKLSPKSPPGEAEKILDVLGIEEAMKVLESKKGGNGTQSTKKKSHEPTPSAKVKKPKATRSEGWLSKTPPSREKKRRGKKTSTKTESSLSSEEGYGPVRTIKDRGKAKRVRPVLNVSKIKRQVSDVDERLFMDMCTDKRTEWHGLGGTKQQCRDWYKTGDWLDEEGVVKTQPELYMDARNDFITYCKEELGLTGREAKKRWIDARQEPGSVVLDEDYIANEEHNQSYMNKRAVEAYMYSRSKVPEKEEFEDRLEEASKSHGSFFNFWTSVCGKKINEDKTYAECIYEYNQAGERVLEKRNTLVARYLDEFKEILKEREEKSYV